MLCFWGRITQLGECNPYKVEVTGSSPVSPTILLLLERYCGGVVQFGQNACLSRRRSPVRVRSLPPPNPLKGTVFKPSPFYLYYLLSSSTIASPMSFVETAVRPGPARSPVKIPFLKTLETAV